MRYFRLLMSRMFNLKQLKKKEENIMARKTLSKKVKVLNLLSKGEPVSWKTLRSRFDLTSPRAMIDQLRSEGNMVYINKTDKVRHIEQDILNLLSILILRNYTDLNTVFSVIGCIIVM